MMNPMVVSILALALTLSQIFKRPIEQFKPHLDAQTDRAEILQIMREGCEFFPKLLTDDELDMDFLVDSAVEAIKLERKHAAAEAKLPIDPNKPRPKKKFFRKLSEQVDPDLLMDSYKIFCKGETLPKSALNLGEVIAYYNKNLTNLPDEKALKGMRLKGASQILDRKGKPFAEMYSKDNRRRWISLSEVPVFVQQAFISAEDQNFVDHDTRDEDGGNIKHVKAHHGVDPLGVLRAFKDSLASKNKPQGGSTITQQVVKNLLVGDDPSFDRKMRESVVAMRVEKILSKNEILELYLNQVYLGPAWGVDLAAETDFLKSVRDIDLAQAASLAALTRNPSLYNPETHPDELQDRRAYVLHNMYLNGYISKPEFQRAVTEKVKFEEYIPLRTRDAFYFLNEVQREAKRVAGIETLADDSYIVRSTLHPELQKISQASLRKGLMQYEEGMGRTEYQPEGNLAQEIEDSQSSWEDILPKAKVRLYDVPWQQATVVKVLSQRKRKSHTESTYLVGLSDGTTATMRTLLANGKPQPQLYDLLYVTVDEKGDDAVATLQIPPRVQGAVVVLEAKTGRVLAISGGFSYAMTPLDRATRSRFQPGSTIKPFVFLPALQLGFQPNTLIPNELFTLPPIGPGGKPWTPQNDDGTTSEPVTMRYAIEQSKNIVAARMMAEMGRDPTENLDYIGAFTQRMGIYKKPVPFFPFVLGAQPARLIDMAVAYATIANIGLKPTAQFIDSIELNGNPVYERDREHALVEIPGYDRLSFLQMRHILEGVLERGTAIPMKDLTGYVAGKTGTSSNFHDAWFIAFTNDLVVATWVGYDSRHIEESLGEGGFGAKVALPIVDEIIKASFDIYKPKAKLAGAPPELVLNKDYTVLPIEPYSGNYDQGNYPEIFRLEGHQIVNTRRSLLEQQYVKPAADPAGPGENWDYENQTPENADPSEDKPFVPGAENMNELWRQRGRQSNPLFD